MDAPPLGSNDSAGEGPLGRQLATMAFSPFAPASRAALVTARARQRRLERLGIDVPLVVVHDLGVLLSGTAPRQSAPPLRIAEDLDDIGERYAQLMRAGVLAAGPRPLGPTPPTDDVVAVMMAQLLTDAWRLWRGAGHGAAAVGGPAVPDEDALSGSGQETPAARLLGLSPAELARRFDPQWALPFLRHLADRRTGLLLRLERLDARMWRLMGMLPAGATPDLAGLLAWASSPSAIEAASLSLDLLPSLLETKRRGGPQRFAIGGYASIEPRGPVHALLPSELAHDEDVFALKALSDDLWYYGHERPVERPRQEHVILIDASASMRGVREVFARALALALGKTLALLGHEVAFRLFDSRLHRAVPLAAGLGRDLPYLLGHRPESGRHTARAFTELATVLEARHAGAAKASGDAARAVTFITHGECHVSASIMERLARSARLYGIFLLPSGPLEVEYLAHLQRYQVLGADALARPQQKRSALRVVDDVAASVAGRVP